MRSFVTIFFLLGTMLLRPAACSAETNAECTARCTAEKADRLAACPEPRADGDPADSACREDGEAAYAGCLAGCPQPDPADAPPRAEEGPAPDPSPPADAQH